MAGIFRKFAPGSISAPGPGASNSPFKSKKSDKDGDQESELTPLQKMVLHAGPVRPNGSDKFFGMENFGNTCYCNSIVQALYYSVPFRENVIKYPPHSPLDTPNGHPPKPITPRTRVLPNGAVISSQGRPKGISAAEALKKKAAMTASQTMGTQSAQRPEDKPDSPEYKKKHAMMTGPILELTHENATTYGMEESTFTSLKDIFMCLISSPSRTGVLSPQRFLEIFKRDNEMFRTAMHQDAHEFYGLVLNAVITSVEDNYKRMRELELLPDTTGLPQALQNGHASVANPLGWTNGTRSPGTGWVHDIFEGVLTSETKCLTCETASQRDETFLDLSIDLEDHSSVTSCLRKFSAEEMLCERNKFHCDTCGGLQEAEKRMKIKKLPKILALHLKRFKYTDDMSRLQKLFHRVVYPYHLRMFNTTDDAEDPDRLYELYAVVVHIGGNAYHGHYVSVIKTQDRGWLLFDDEMVEPVDKHYVRNFFGDNPGMACAYLLFYRETTVEAMRKKQEVEGLAEVALASQEADVALGHAPVNGTHPSSTSKPVVTIPIEERSEFVSIPHAATMPVAQDPGSSKPARVPTMPISPISSAPLLHEPPKVMTKEEKEREKKEAKEAEKMRKAAEKEKLKEQEKRRKELEHKRKEYERSQAEETKKAIALNKQSATEEEERRRREGPTITTEELAQNNGTAEKESKGFKFNKLSRNHKGNKSMSRKSFPFLSRPNGNAIGHSASESSAGISPNLENETSDKHHKSKKERFSFTLGRKKSNLFNSQ